MRWQMNGEAKNDWSQWRNLVLEHLKELREKMDELLTNHLPHLRSDIQNLELRIAALEKGGTRTNGNKMIAWLQFWSPIVLTILGIAAISWGLTR